MHDRAGARERGLEVVRPTPSLSCRSHETPERMENQPEGQSEYEREDDAFDGEREGGHPVVEGGAREFGIGVRAEVSDLSKEGRVQCVEGDLQTGHGLNE